MAVRKYSRAGLFLLLLALLLFWIWYWRAADYSYEAIVGTYAYSAHGETSQLVLNEDRTFLQERTLSGNTERAQGTWRRSGEGGVSFSKEFLPIGQVHPDSDGETYGEIKKVVLELIPSIVVGPDRENGPRFRKKLFE